MSNTFVRFLAGTLALLALGSVTFAAEAASVRVRCDAAHDRSRASVDGNNLAPGSYQARLTSGNHVAMTELQQSDGDEAEFDFDSDRGDVREGATKISRHFIVGASVTGEILDADGNVVASETRKCKKQH